MASPSGPCSDSASDNFAGVSPVNSPSPWSLVIPGAVTLVMSSSPKGTTSDGPFGSLNPFAEPPWYNAINSPYYGATHRCLRDFIRAYVDEYIIPNCEEWEAQGFIPKQVTSSPLKSRGIDGFKGKRTTCKYGICGSWDIPSSS